MAQLKLEGGSRILTKWAKKPFAQLFRGWIAATEKYCNHFGGTDASYYFNERANISLLAAGAWLEGGIAVEEYYTARNRKGVEGDGRCDLFVSLGKHNVEIEAKAFLLRGT